jgi:hypothetical protein
VLVPVLKCCKEPKILLFGISIPKLLWNQRDPVVVTPVSTEVTRGGRDLTVLNPGLETLGCTF